MALTITELDRVRPFKGKGQLYVEIAFDDHYPAAGEAIVAADLGVNSISNGVVLEVSAGSLITHARWNNSSGVLLAFKVDEDTGLLEAIGDDVDLQTTTEKVKMLFFYD